jgi:hypothetical protein
MLEVIQAVVVAFETGLFGPEAIQWAHTAAEELVPEEIDEERVAQSPYLPFSATTLLEHVEYSLLGMHRARRTTVGNDSVQTCLYFLFDELRDDPVDELVARLHFATDAEWGAMKSRVAQALAGPRRTPQDVARTISLLPAWVTWGPGRLRSAVADIGRNLLGIGYALEEEDLERALTAWHIDPGSPRAVDAAVQAFGFVRPVVPGELVVEWTSAMVPPRPGVLEWDYNMLAATLASLLGIRKGDRERQTSSEAFFNRDPVVVLVESSAWKRLFVHRTEARQRLQELENILAEVWPQFDLADDGSAGGIHVRGNAYKWDEQQEGLE